MANTNTAPNRKDMSGRTRSQRNKMVAALTGLRFPLPVAANVTTTEVADHSGDVQAIILTSNAVGAGMTYDVQVAGVTVLTAPFVHSAAYPANTEIVLPLAANKRIKHGELVAVIRSTFAGGSSVVKVVYG